MTKKISPKRNDPPPRAVPVELVSRSRPLWLFGTALFLSLFVLGTYVRIYDPHFGWTKLIDFGSVFSAHTLPRLQHHTHYVMEGSGNDGEFYAQMAIDPSVQDPAFDRALDTPAYRARRIGLPAISYALGWSRPARVIQAYALSNLLFWFVLLGALVSLYRPWTGKQVLCFAVGLVSFGSVTSMEHAMVDLPAAALIFVGLAVGRWGRHAAFAAAVLTRETSLVAALGCLNLRRPLADTRWKRELGLLALAVVPFALWMLYIRHRFDGLQGTTGSGNFAFPLQAIAARFASGIKAFADNGLGEAARTGPFGWLYLDESVHELLTLTALTGQALYFVLRRDVDSAIWRTGICYAALCCILGPAVWGSTFAAARVLLPMTLCFYLLIARERDVWFWPLFVVGSLSVPYGVHGFWVYS